MEMIDNDKDKNLKGSALSATDDVFIRQMEQAEAGVSDSDNPEAVDLVKSYISTLQANPEGNIRPQDMLFDYKNIKGIEINGKKKGLLWTMNASNDYYKAMYPNLTDDMLDGMRELYTGWQSVYNTGEIGNYATGNADGKNLSHVMHSMYGMNTISNVKFTHNVNPNTSAQMKDYYLDADGNIQSGSPAIRDFAPSGKSGYSYPLTVLQQDPYGDGYVYRVIDTKDKTTHGLATTMPMGGEMFIYRPRQTASRLLEKGKYFTYVDSDGVEKEVKSIIIDENGNRYTTNRFLGGQKEYDDYDLKEALDLKDVLEKQFGGSYDHLGAATFTVWSDKDAISVKQHKQPTYYKDRNSFMSWVGHSFKESYFDMYAWMGNMIFDNKKWDDIYYENLMRKYQNPVGIPSTTESPYYNRNIAKMTGDLLAQMLPSIITAGMTGAISASGIALKATQVVSGVVKNTVKATAKATVKKQAVNQGVRSGVFLGREGGMLMVKQPLKQTVIKQHGKRWLRTASWSVPAAGQSGFGTYREGLESGVVDHDAAGISLLAAAITLGTSRLLEPTWIRSGMFVKLDKNVVNSTVNNLVSKMGLQVVTKEGRSKFVRNGITELLKNVQGKGVGAWSLELGLNAFMEGAQEYVEGTMIGWTQMIYNKYNRGDYSKRVGEGLYDVDGFFSADSSEFILGSLMGFGASVIPSMTTLGSAIRYSKEKRAKDDNYMLYSLFAAKGTDKVVKEFQSNILQRRANGQLGSTNHDINGNQIKMDADGNPIGETMDISDSPFAAVLGDILRTEADMNAYNMLMEGLREAEIFDYIKGTKISQDVDSDLLISADVKNNMAVEAALAYKNVKQKRERIEAIQESLNDPNLKSEEKDKLTDELDTLTATDLRNDNTLAYWENKLDHWSKPLDTVEYDGKVLTGYKYSEGIRRSIINTSFAADKYIITKAYQLGMDVDENIAGSKGFAELFANSDRFLDIFHAYHEYFGRVEPNSINVKTGKPVYNGLSGLFKAFNDRVGQIHSQETKDAADTLKNALKGKLGNIKGLIEKRRKGEIDIVSLQQAVNDELKDIFGGESLESVGKQLGWTYDGFTEALSNDITNITSALGDIGSLNEAMKDTEVDDMLQEYFTIQDAISKNVTDAFQGIDSYVTEGRLEAEELTVETIEADSVQSTDDKQKLDKLFEEIKNKAISGIMLYEIAPMEDIPLMFRNYSLADLINFIDANKTSPMDMNTMLALDKAIRIYKAHMNNIGMYLWGLETLKATADTNQMLKEGHTYDNQITRRFIDERANLEMKLIDDHDKISLMYENMKKNGFSKLKEELRYQAAHLSNTNMYMTDTLYHTAIPYLTRFFDVKDGVVSLPDNLPDGTVESFLKKRIELYLEKKYPNEKERKAKLQEILKAMDDNIQDVKKVLDAYFNAVQDLMNKWYGTPQQSGNSGTVNLHDPNAVNIMLERLFSDTSQNQEKAITDFTAMMNEMYVLQWKYREQLSGKMTPFLLWTEAVAEHNDLVYKALGEHKGIKLYIPEDSTTTGNDIVYRGTFAPGDLQLGKSMLFDTVNDIQRSDYNELVNIATTRMLMTPEELKSYDSTKTEALRDALLDKIENSKVNRDTALHYIVTNMGIDNFMGGNNMTVMQCLGHIKQNVIDSLIDRMQLNGRKLSDSVAKKIRKAIVIKDGIMDEEATMKSLLDVLEDIKDIDDLGATAKMIYSSLNTAITLEQEYAVIHLVSSFYRHSDGNNMLGVLMEDKDAATLLDKSVAVLGAGGTGKSTMVLENYYYVTKQILTKERKTYNGKVIPTKKKVKILVASPTHAVNNIQEANIKKVYGDEADVVKITFHDMQSMNLNDIDIIVIDEASLIDNNKNKNAAKEDKQYSDYGVLMDMVRRVNPQHVVAIYDTNQTANMRNYSAPEITTMLGERTIPLQMRHRTGYVDLNVLSNIFSDDAYAVQCTANNGLVPLTRNGVPFNAKWKKDVNGNKKGVRITGNVSDVIQDYLDAKKTNSDGNMIIVRTAKDKANLLSKYESLGVVPEDVYILEYGDKDFNVSGRNSRNVFVIVDGKYIDKAAPILKSDLYRLHAKMLNTAITRLRGDGYVSLYYPNGDVHSTEVEANDILLQYKNTLDIDYGVDTKEIINEFGSMAVTALRLQNNSYIRMTDPEQEIPQSTTQDIQSTTQDIQQVYEDISDTMADVIEEMRSEEAIDGAKPISDKVYENISGTDEVAMNVNNIVREGLKIIYRKVQEGVLNISKFSVQPNTADFDKVYGDIIKAIAKHYATQGINMGNYTEKDILYIIHNVVLNSISDTGIQVMADMNKHTAIISPNLNVNIGGTDYVATPFMVNVVGYETNADKTLTPIFDIYELDISQSPRNNVDEVAEGNKKKAAYAIAILAAKGYKVNKVHFLNFVLTPGKRVTTTFNNRFTTDDTIFVFDGKSYESIYSSIKSEQGEEVKVEDIFADKDALLKLGVIMPLEDAERNSRYQNLKTKNVSYIVGKELKMVMGDKVVYYHLANGDVLTDVEFGHTYQRVENKEKKQYYFGATLYGHIRTPLNAIPAIAVQGQNLPQSRVEFYDHPFFKKLRGDGAYKLKGKEVKAEYHEELSFFQWDSKTESTKSVTYYNVVLYKDGDKIVGVQERLRFSNNTEATRKQLDAMVAKYVKAKDEKEASDILNDIERWLMDCEKQYSEDHSFDDSNVAYQIDKIKNIRKVAFKQGSYVVGDVSNGTHIISEIAYPLQELVGRRVNKGESIVDWEQADSNRFSVIATFMIDGRKVDIHCDAAKVDDSYIANMKTMAKDFRKRYNKILKGDEAAIGNDIARLAMEMQASELTDFLYANRERLEKVNLYDFSKKFIDFKLGNKKKVKGGKVNVKNTMANMLNQIDLAIKIADNSRKGALDMAWNKAIFMTNVLAASNETLYLNNLVSKVIDVSTPTLEITEKGADSKPPVGGASNINNTINNQEETNTQIIPEQKQQAQQLFESNPELANAVYEALGFKTKPEIGVSISKDLLSIEENEIPKKEGESFSEMQARVKQNINIRKRIEIANKNNIKQGKLYSFSELESLLDNSIFDNDIYNDLRSILPQITFRFGSLNKVGKKRNGYYDSTNKTINLEILHLPNSDFRRTLLHEIIHAATFINLEEDAILTDVQKTALNNLNNLIEELKKDRDFFGEYGLTNANELLAELANKNFVNKLKKKTFSDNQSFFEKIISEIVTLLGLNTTAYDIVKESFDSLVKEYKSTNQITPEQKQEAQQLYSEYLEQNPNGNVEQFKSWVEKFNKKSFGSIQESGIGTEDLDNQVKGDPFFNNNEGNGFSVFRISKEGEAVDMSTDDDVRAATAEVQRIVGDSFVSNNLKFNERIIEEGVSREVFGKLSGNIITLSYRSGSLMPVIARHEAMHFVLDFCLSPDEYDRVMSAQRAILMREHKMRGEGTVPTDTDVLEAICEGFENYKYKPSTKPKNFLERLYYALKRFFERFMKNRRTIEKLYSRADSGFYANEALHKYNNNLLREDRYAIARGSLSNEYNSYEAVTELSNFYGGKINIIDNVLDTQLKIILNRSIETGKIVLKPKDSYREVASVYLNLISEANFEEIDGLVISYNVVEDGVTVEKELTLKELLYNNNELDVAMFTEMTTNPNIKSDIGNADLIRRLAGDITGHIYSNPKLALATLAFHYPMMERAYKGNNDMVNIYMQMLDPFIDMREMISDTERLVKQKEKHGKKIDHKMLTSSQTFNKPSGVNDHTNYKFKDMIENITYRKGKFMSNVSFSEFSSIIKKCNLIFTEDINNKFKDKIVLGYDDIMALIKSQINDGTNSKYTTQAIYSYFSNEAPKGYDKNNEESMNTFFYNEWSDNYQGFNFNNYGYGFMLQRINDYLEEGSISNKLLKDATGNFYNQVEAILIEKRAAITANVINTFVNYFNSMDVVNSHVANVDNTIVSMINFTSSSTNKMIGDIAYNNMFEEHNENYGFTDRAKKLKKEYKINGYKDTITYKYTNGDGVVVQGKINTKLQEFSVEDVQAIERLLVAVYDNYIVSENIYNPSLQNEGKYRVNRKAVNTAIQVIDMLHTFNPALGVKPEIPLSYVSLLNQGIEVILSSTSKNAEGENVSNIKVKTPLTLALNNSGKIASLSQDMTMYNPDAVVIEQLVKEATEYTFDDTVELEDGDIEDIIDMMIDDETLIYTDENNNPCVPTVPKVEEGMRGNDFTKGSKWTMIEEFDGATHSEGGIDIKLTDRGFTFAREDGDVLAVNGLLIAKK
ncbi:MAG: hypothetical protein WDA47_00165 [Bacilli bacterium]